MAWEVDHDEIVADFAQYYGLIVSAKDIEDEFETMACLWSQLPAQSRCVVKYNPEAEWDDTIYILNSMEFALRNIVWLLSKDGRKNRNKPKPRITPGEHAKREKARDNALEHKTEIDRILGIGGE